MSLELVQRVVNDFHSPNLISEGTFTIGELKADRLALYINLIDLLKALYELNGLIDIVWISNRDHEGNSSPGYMHLGLFHKDPKLCLGAKIPDSLWGSYKTRAHILETAPEYKSLSNSLPNYFYDKLK